MRPRCAGLLKLGYLVAAAMPAAAHGVLDELPQGRWTLIHEQSESDAVRFKRQRHGGSAFDSRRGRIVLFGSDTHGEDWANAPLYFDVHALGWSRPYDDDDAATYRVDDAGIPVAGVAGDHPWAMHTFAAVAYHEAADALIVSSFPEHLAPGRFTDAMAAIWPAIRRNPTWVLDMASDRWTPLAAPAVHFFPYATAYDPYRRVVIGYRADGVYELAGEPWAWTKILGPGLLGWHNNAVFDTRHRALVVFGSHENSNDIVVYAPATRRHEKMPTPGVRPPKTQHAPMAFHPGLSRTVVLIDRDEPGRERWAETWLYDLGRDAWTRLADVTLPLRLGMNYNMVYDTMHNLLLLVARPAGRPTGVWALRL